jgi:N-acetylmuramoyl-L-alanine amidase
MCALFIVTVEAAEAKESYNFPDGSAPVDVYFGGRQILADESAIIESVTYVPLRAFAENADAQSVSWSQSTRTATVKKNGAEIKIKDGASYVEANGRFFYAPTKIININDRLFVPIRAISPALSLDVEWDAKTKSVLVTDSAVALVSGARFYNETDLYWLARIISAEAAGEPLAGKIAIGNVVINRKNSPAYPNTIYGVIFDRKYGTQFSPVSFGTVYNTPTAESIIAAKICLEGYSLSDKILFFVNPKLATSNWISNSRPFVFRIGNHWFYS